MKQYLLLLLLLPIVFSCREEEVIPVEIDVTLHIRDDNHTAPLEVYIENNTRQAEGYLWTFEGGEPASSNQDIPPTVIFRTPGEHLIRLEAWNKGDRKEQTFTVRVDSTVTAGFKAEAIINHYAPADIQITNLSNGGTSYKWTFEGGTPSEYTGKHPPLVNYNREGIYLITLKVENGSATFLSQQQVEIGPIMEGSFEIAPSFEDEDYEAPLRANLVATLQGVETIRWETDGGEITRPTSADATVFYPNPGIYTVFLTIGNGKETQQLSQNIVVKPNNNLRTHSNIRLGINTAQATIGACYSTRLRRNIKSRELSGIDPTLIDIVYAGLNDRFSLNRFISPDSAAFTVLKPIPGATKTLFINRQESGTVYITPAQFVTMTNDNLIRPIPISTFHYGWESFEATPLPRVVLFETADRRKGAIYVKEFVSAGNDGSYMLVDIKIQKND